jgi:hypothetical protein
MKGVPGQGRVEAHLLASQYVDSTDFDDSDSAAEALKRVDVEEDHSGVTAREVIEDELGWLVGGLPDGLSRSLPLRDL